MAEQLNLLESDAEIVPGRKISARVAGAYIAPAGDFQTEAVEALSLGLDASPGIRAAPKCATSGSFRWSRPTN